MAQLPRDSSNPSSEETLLGACLVSLKATDRQTSVTETATTSMGISRNSTEEADAAAAPLTFGSASRLDLSEDDLEVEHQSEKDCDESPAHSVPAPMLGTERKITFVPWDSNRYRKLRVLRPFSQNWTCQIELHQDTVPNRTVTVKRFSTQWIVAQTRGNRDNRRSWETVQESLLLERLSSAPDAFYSRAEVHQDLSTGDLLLVCDQELETSLFDHCMGLGPPGLEREAAALQILRSLLKTAMTLHDVGVTHGRIRAESTWLRRGSDGSYEVVLSDFAGSKPWPSSARGCKDAMYHAPEASPKGTQAADLFACGVLGYALAIGRYPWLSTQSGQCKAFNFAQCHGIQSFLQTSKCPASKEGCMSSDYRAILDSLLDVDPCARLEKATMMHSLIRSA